MEERAPAELATIAVGWDLLHEVRAHTVFSKRGKSADSHEEEPSNRHDEEFECDRFATGFLLDGVDTYALMEGVDSELVLRKTATKHLFRTCSLLLSSRKIVGMPQILIPLSATG